MEPVCAICPVVTGVPDLGASPSAAADPFLALLVGLLQPAATPPAPVAAATAPTAEASAATAPARLPATPPAVAAATMVVDGAPPMVAPTPSAPAEANPPEPSAPPMAVPPPAPVADVPPALAGLAPAPPPAPPREGDRRPDGAAPTPTPDRPVAAAAGVSDGPALADIRPEGVAEVATPPDPAPGPAGATAIAGPEDEPVPDPTPAPAAAPEPTGAPTLELEARRGSDAPPRVPDEAPGRTLPPVQLSATDRSGRAIEARIEVTGGSGGGSRVHIQLEPADLGRVEVALRLDDAGGAAASFTVDRPETLQLLQRDARVVNELLGAAGFTVDQGGLDFSLRDPGGQGGGDQRRGGAAAGPWAETDAEGLPGQPAPTRGHGLLDLRV
jgi:hypothetical protein